MCININNPIYRLIWSKFVRICPGMRASLLVVYCPSISR